MKKSESNTTRKVGDERKNDEEEIGKHVGNRYHLLLSSILLEVLTRSRRKKGDIICVRTGHAADIVG